MDRLPCSYAESILAGTAEVEGGWIRSATAGGNGKETVLSVVEVLDEKECLIALPGFCATYGMLPSGCLPTGHLVIDHQSTICVGGVDVRRGTLDGAMVTVKSLPLSSLGSSDTSQENAYREVITWKNLNHPNILPLLGVDTSVSPFSTISAWMEYGSLREYLARFPNAPRSKLLFDASRGLEYMHSLDCIHGDLKSFNVLVNDDHSAVLTNFRLASFVRASEMNTGAPISECDPSSVRWLAPELLFPEEFGLESARRTKETDIYAFAMVMYETFSGLFPFQGLRNEALILPVRSGDRPCRPEGGSGFGLTDEIWKMIEACWECRDRRWKISRIVSTLGHHSAVAVAATG